jgi:PPOX class probable F420-dependent enzyme
MSTRMSRAEREAFLADVHVGIVSIAEPGRGPLTVPIWYAYEPGGEVRLLTEAGSRKGRLLRAASRFSLCVQTEDPPYRYVSVEGPIVAIEDSDRAHDARPMAHRYLGKELGDQYIQATASESGQGVLVRMQPERWLTVDYRKQFGGE